MMMICNKHCFLVVDDDDLWTKFLRSVFHVMLKIHIAIESMGFFEVGDLRREVKEDHKVLIDMISMLRVLLDDHKRLVEEVQDLHAVVNALQEELRKTKEE